MKMSFGLFLIYNLITALRAGFTNRKLKENTKKNKSTNRTIVLEYEELSEEVVPNIIRIKIKQHFGNELRTSFWALKNAYRYKLKQMALKDEKDHKMNYEDEFDKICAILEKKGSKHLKRWCMLEKYKDIDTIIDDKEWISLGVQCTTILEAVHILVDNGVSQANTTVKKSAQMTLAKPYVKEILSIPSRPKNLPLIVRPHFWKKNTKTPEGNLNYGGYLYNKTLNYPAILNHHKKGVTVITSEDLDSINYVQSNFYQINEPFFNYVELNFKKIVGLYLRKIPHTSFFIDNLDQPDNPTIRIRSIEDLLSKDTELSRKKSDFEKQPRNKILKNQVGQRRGFLIEQYQKIASLFCSFLHSIILASCYRNNKFYFPVFLDTRGRFYYVSAGAAFGLQTGDFFKSIADLAGNDYSYKKPITYGINYQPSNKAYVDYVKSLKKDKEPFSSIRVEKKVFPTSIPNDASCSGTSILSGLIGYKKGLLLTNVCREKNSDTYEKTSVYTIFLKKMCDEYPTSWSSLYSTDKIESLAKKHELEMGELTRMIDYNLAIIEKQFLQREHAKAFLMRLNYSEGNSGRGRYIYDEICVPVFYVGMCEEIEAKIYRSLSHYLADWVEKLYQKMFPDVAEFCLLIQTLFERKNPITLSSSLNNSEFEYQQLLYETSKIPRTAFNTIRKSDLSIHVRTDKVDLKKIKQSIVANFTHYLDSRLNLLVINKCRHDNILVWTNHDSFYVCPTKKSIVLKHYFDSYVELLLKTDVITHFFKQNNVEITNSTQSLLDKYKANRESILGELEQNQIEMSEFILTS